MVGTSGGGGRFRGRIRALEGGDVLFLPALPFAVEPSEALLFTPSILGSSKNASYDPGRAVWAARPRPVRTQTPFAVSSTASANRPPRWSTACCRPIAAASSRGRASFRPAEIAGRQSTWRKDDTRLHVDSFPATPSGGRRILRVFSNVNPEGRARPGGSATISRRSRAASRRSCACRCPAPVTCSRCVRVTKTPRSAYDALMLQLHDCMKGDDAFQKDSPQSRVDLPAGSTWLAFTDQVSHAATAGQYQLEQTFLLPVDAMAEPERSPLRVLERLKQRRLT